MDALSESLKSDMRTALAAVSGAIPGYRPRRSQRQMIAEIANAMAGAGGDTPPILAIEAPTGTGKTVGYLVPLVPLAASLGMKLVISTSTVALQSQLAERDIPLLAKAAGWRLKVAEAKGRGRYVCLTRLARATGDGSGDLFGDGEPILFDSPLRPGDTEALETLFVEFLHGRWDGCRDSWSREVADPTWRAVTTDRHGCSGALCPKQDTCAFYRARDGLADADVIITNHDLVLADLEMGGGVLLPPPDECLVVFDEAHHLAHKARNRFASHVPVRAASAWAGHLPEAARKLLLLARLEEGEPALAKLAEQSETLSGALDDIADLVSDNDNRFEPPGLDRSSDPIWRFAMGRVPDEVAAPVRTACKSSGKILSVLNGLRERIVELARTDANTYTAAQSVISELGGLTGQVERDHRAWTLFGREDEPDAPPVARWVRNGRFAGRDDFILEAEPTSAAALLRAQCWSRFAGVVLTSATLTSLKSFDAFLREGGLAGRENVRTVTLPSPFDFRRCATLRVPRMRSDPKSPKAHTAEIIENLPSILDGGKGSLVLFTSKRQMLDVAEALRDSLGAPVLVQGEVPKQALLETHRARIEAGGGSVIFGLASFAEGVDLPGRYCEHVVIAKLPFAPPDSPAEATLVEWMQARGQNPFMEITVPAVSLKLIQWCGRLIRTETDTGEITIFDPRLTTKPFGRRILDALPAFRREIGAISGPRAAA